MIKLINEQGHKITLQAFARYQKLVVNPHSVLNLTHPLDLTREGAQYYKRISSVLNVGVEVDDKNLRDYSDVEALLWEGKLEVEVPGSEEDKQEDIKPEPEVESKEPEVAPVEETPEEETTDSATSNTELKAQLESKDLSQLKELLATTGTEVSGRVTKSSAIKALLANEESTLKALAE